MCIGWVLHLYYESSDVNWWCFVSGPIVSNLEPKSVFKEDDVEACDNIGTPTSADVQIGTPSPSLVSKPQLLPSIAEQFQEALMAAPSFDCAPLPSVQFPINQDYSTRLQRILQLEKQQHAEILKGVPLDTPLDSIQVNFCLLELIS
jgi:hypothetical protein